MRIIKSLENNQIKKINKLKTTEERDKIGNFIAEGIRTCKTLIESGATLEQVYVTEKMLPHALHLASQEKINIVTASVMKKMSSSITPSGLLCLFKMPSKPNLDLLNSGIILCQISDPGNMGTLIRTAIAIGIQSIVLIEGVNPWSTKVIQASAGTIGYANIFQLTWNELLKNKNKLKLCALTVEHGKPPEKINFNNILLVIGNEAHGIPKEWVKQCDERITIPMKKNVESLNAAIAGSIAMYLLFSKITT